MSNVEHLGNFEFWNIEQLSWKVRKNSMFWRLSQKLNRYSGKCLQDACKTSGKMGKKKRHVSRTLCISGWMIQSIKFYYSRLYGIALRQVIAVSAPLLDIGLIIVSTLAHLPRFNNTDHWNRKSTLTRLDRKTVKSTPISCYGYHSPQSSMIMCMTICEENVKTCEKSHEISAISMVSVL